jgi:hypothetical protein
MTSDQNDAKESTDGDGTQDSGKRNDLMPARIVAALTQLAEARFFAKDSGADEWDFSIEIHNLNLQMNDLRWLVSKELVGHLQETTRRGSKTRSFRADNGLVFTDRSCFVLTEIGQSLVAPFPREAIVSDRSANYAVGSDGNDRLFPPRPSWVSERRELWFAGKLVKQFRVPSANQEAVISAFQEEAWPCSIDDPLTPRHGQDPKRRLHHTIRNLNRHQKNCLIHFEGNGTGQKVLWTRNG